MIDQKQLEAMEKRSQEICKLADDLQEVCYKASEALSKLLAEVKRLTAENEALRAERDAILEDLRSENPSCDTCQHEKKSWGEYPCSACVFNDMTDSHSGEARWQWRGAQEEE